MREGERFLTLQEAETLTGRKVATWRRDLLLKKVAYVKFGRQVRIPLSEIERLVMDGWRGAKR